MIRRSGFLYKLITVGFILSLLTVVVPTQIARADTVVNFPDPNLDAAIRVAIDKPSGDIYQSDLEGLTYLMVYRGGITDLTGMEYCTSLTALDLWGNQISSLTPLSGLTNLTELILNENQISDISSLSNLTSLTALDLWGNQISSLTPLSDLTSLTALDLSWNQINDISPLSGLTNLHSLLLDDNQISDISPLTNLTSLTTLGLGWNQISDTSPLSGLTSLAWLYLPSNQINDLSPFSNLTDLEWLSLYCNQISDIEPLVNNTGISDGDSVDLTENPLSITSLNFYIPQLVGRGVYVEYDVPVVTFPDPNLDAAIRTAIGKPSGDIFSTDLLGMTYIEAYNMDITDLTGMEYCINLQALDLSFNQISDISPLSGLTNLYMLALSGNQITNLYPLAGLTNLGELLLTDNQISTISPLAGLINLKMLDLVNNQISDIEPLVDNAGLSDGDTVLLWGNPLSNTSIDVYVPELELRGVWVIIALPPGVETEAASEVTENTATLNGDLAFLGTASSVFVSFEWGLAGYTYETTPQLMETTGPFSATLDSLSPSPGIYHFRAKAVGDGTAYGNDMILITNYAPVANDDSYNIDEDTVLAVAAPGLLNNDTDMDSNTLTASIVTGPVHGNLALSSDGSFSYTPNANWNGSDSFTYKVSDGALDSNIATVIITINSVNDAPVVYDQSVSTDEDIPQTIILGASDIDGDALLYIIVSEPANGLLSRYGEFPVPDILYTPLPNYYGSDSFTYKVNDGTVDSYTATVTITVNSVNDVPSAGDNGATIEEDYAVTIPVLLNDYDADGDTLYVSGVTNGDHGTVVNNGTDITYTPETDWSGIDTFTYDVSDGNGGSDTATVIVTVNAVNDAPVAVDDVYMAEKRTTLNVSAPGVLGNDTDVEGDQLTAILVTGPANGTLILNADGSFTYTPGPNNKTGDSFTYKAHDGIDESNEATVTIIIDTPGTNTAPEIGITGSPAANEGELLTFTITGTDDTPLQGLTYSAAGLPEGANFDENTGLFEWIPDYTQAGLHDIVFTVSDGELSDSMTVICAVTDVWNITSLTSTKIKPGSNAEVKFSLTDANGAFVKGITDLTIAIFDIYNASETSTANESISEEYYYTMYQTSSTKMTYSVEVYQGDLLVGTFTFRTK